MRPPGITKNETKKDKMMKMRSLFLLLTFVSLAAVAAPKVTEPSRKTPTTFAIVVDQNTLDNIPSAIMAYRRVVEDDGLGTYVISDNWGAPSDIRAILKDLHEKNHLEGAVLVGDVPVPMLRDAQHLTSAFKMDQTRDWQESSVPSDRYYDNFGLEFRLVKQDSLRSDYWYYSLLPSGRQSLHCDIYTARIKPLVLPGRDKCRQIADYLNKVVEERTRNAGNTLDCLSMARGHGYNSEDKCAWAGEQLALKEQLPSLFKAGGSVRFIDFQSRYPVKPYFMNEVQRPGLDVMLFHHHGAPDTQYLNGDEESSDFNTSIFNAKLYTRQIVQRIHARAKGEKTKEQAAEEFAKAYNVPMEWCMEAFDDSIGVQDSLYYLNYNIVTSDIRTMTPSARFVMFDACYNGSFHQDDYVAGSYLFNNGTTLVTQGNTVNTIQDKWPDELMGLWASGMRLGEWHRHVCFLETHMHGDPTFRFATTQKLPFDINRASVLRGGDAPFWRKCLSMDNADLQCLAIRKLLDMNDKGMDERLQDIYFSSPYGVVRLEALFGLRHYPGARFEKALSTALFDSYELCRRFAANFMEKYSDPVLAPFLAKALVTHATEARMAYYLSSSIDAVGHDAVRPLLKKEIASRHLTDTTLFAPVFRQLAREATLDESMQEAKDAKTERQRISRLRSFRNGCYTAYWRDLLAFALNGEETLKVRLVAAEALGWYNWNKNRALIAQTIEQSLASVTEPSLKDEFTKTLRRLRGE